jgi:hypothetical protein
VLEVPDAATVRPEIRTYFLNRSQRINTGDVTQPEPTTPSQRYFSSLFFTADYFA